MQALRIVSIGLLLVGVLAGCGQKGPLYREAPADIAGGAVEADQASNPGQNEDTTEAGR